jgi:hypothetical protein
VRPARRRFASALLIGAAMAVSGSVPALASATKRATARVPSGFVGMNPEGIELPDVDTSAQLDQIRRVGVRSLRVAFYWNVAQPYQDWSQVPLSQTSQFRGGPVPTDFEATDAIVSEAARRHLSVLPVVLAAPTWDAVVAPKSMPTPKANAPYGAYLTLLILRYGPHGSFWQENPAVPYAPIRMWQVWNEPSLLSFWAIHPWLASYLSLLKVAHNAIKQADPGAKVVLGGLTNFSWHDIAWIERVRGARRLFDVAAVHPYTRTPAGVMTILDRFRMAMDRNGDPHKPIMITEFGWPSAVGQTNSLLGFDATQAGQASRLDAFIPMLLAQRAALNISAIYYYMWIGNEYRNAPAFNYAGLLADRDGQISLKPVYAVFRRWALWLDSRSG